DQSTDPRHLPSFPTRRSSDLIQALKDAFEEGLDIHAMTASEMFKVPIEGMPSEVRRRAKAINFGIIYGISAFGLANQLGIARSRSEEHTSELQSRENLVCRLL